MRDLLEIEFCIHRYVVCSFSRAGRHILDFFLGEGVSARLRNTHHSIRSEI